MNAVDHFRRYLATCSWERLRELQNLEVKPPRLVGNLIAAKVITINLRKMVRDEALVRTLGTPAA